MPGTAVGLFVIDFIARPFAKIFEKMPLIMFAVMVVLYGIVAYVVMRSAWQAEQDPQP
jgi:hypothetical protein